jgi:alkylated DNA repair dioxygenase AlkB
MITDSLPNLLPHDGIVNYYGKIMPEESANFWFEKLTSTIAWEHDQAVVFGKHYITPRKVAWYAEIPMTYKYSGIVKSSLPFTDELKELKSIAEEICQSSFNSCLLNLYHNGSEGMAWHSDAEKELSKHAAIASLSFGAERTFAFKHKKMGEKINVMLQNGSLLVMKGATQDHWLHRLTTSKKIVSPRINLTFRKMNV